MCGFCVVVIVYVVCGILFTLDRVCAYVALFVCTSSFEFYIEGERKAEREAGGL